MEIRIATPADAAKSIAFLRELRGEGLKTAVVQELIPTSEFQQAYIQRLDGHEGVMILAENKGRIVGCLTCERKKHERMRHSCLFSINVLEPSRGQGVGTRLIERLKEWAASAEIRRVELCVFHDSARRLYERLGFIVEGKKADAIELDDGFTDIYEMVLMIG